MFRINIILLSNPVAELKIRENDSHCRSIVLKPMDRSIVKQLGEEKNSNFNVENFVVMFIYWSTINQNSVPEVLGKTNMFYCPRLTIEGKRTLWSFQIPRGKIVWSIACTPISPLNAKTLIVYNVTLPYIPEHNDKTSRYVACFHDVDAHAYYQCLLNAFDKLYGNALITHKYLKCSEKISSSCSYLTFDSINVQVN